MKGNEEKMEELPGENAEGEIGRVHGTTFLLPKPLPCTSGFSSRHCC